jgi:hypothetical protein
MRRVILESPYAAPDSAGIQQNLDYARACLRDCLERGEAPIASHLLYTQPGVLRDEVPEERQWGIAAGLVWAEVAEAAVFYIDRGWSNGMLAARATHESEGTPIEERELPGYDADWIEFSQLGSPFEQRMTRERPGRWQHRKRGDLEWIEGRPGD